MIFFPFIKTKATEDTPQLYVDIHSHLIPFIDDGARDMKESLTLLRALEETGYTKVITTPHIMVDTYCNTSQSIKQGLKKLRQSAKYAGITIQIDAAAEYYVDEGFLAHLYGGDILSIGGEYILFETSYMAKPLQLDKVISEIISAGYKPLLAHPERYRYIHDLKEEYGTLKAKGVYFQVNINSFGGHYGKEARTKANFLNKNGMIDFLGSDAHHIKQVEALADLQRKSVYRSIFKQNNILNNRLLVSEA